MNKYQLAERLARRSRQSRGDAADKLDNLIYKLWRESRVPKLQSKGEETPATSTAPAKKL